MDKMASECLLNDVEYLSVDQDMATRLTILRFRGKISENLMRSVGQNRKWLLTNGVATRNYAVATYVP